MASRKKPKTTPTARQWMDAETQELCDLMLKYPWRWFSQNAVGRAMGFGEDSMADFAQMGAPIARRRTNALLFNEWLSQNWHKIEKTGSE